MDALIELLQLIFKTNGLLGLLVVLSFSINFLFLIILYKKIIKNRKNIPQVVIPQESIHTFKEPRRMSDREQLEEIEKMLSSIKKDLEYSSSMEHTAIREMLFKITSSIELLVKTLEYASMREK